MNKNLKYVVIVAAFPLSAQSTNRGNLDFLRNLQELNELDAELVRCSRNRDVLISSLSAFTEEPQLQNTTLIIGLWCFSQWENLRFLIFSTFKWRAFLRRSFRLDYLWFIVVASPPASLDFLVRMSQIVAVSAYPSVYRQPACAVVVGVGAELLLSACLNALCLQLCLKYTVISISVRIH